MRAAEPPGIAGATGDELAPRATVDLEALARNVDRLRARAGAGVRLLAAVKADAYGHGLVPVARALARRGVGWFGVATPQEALTLRRAKIPGRILVFGPVYGPFLRRLIAAGVDLTITDADDVQRIVRARTALERAPGGVPAGPPESRLHLKVDTGMGRIGRAPGDAPGIAASIVDAPGLRLTAVWTHFARADEPACETNRVQLDRFHQAVAALDAAGLRPELRHAANSSALLTLPESRFDMVRPGLALYGHHGSAAVAEAAPELEPVMTLDAPVVFVKRVAAGTAVSYGHIWRARRDTTIATVRIGYGDGYPRALSNVGEARLAGGTAPVAGTVCMDQTMFDAGDLPVNVGDRAVLFGRGGPPAADLAERIGTIPYELLTRLGDRVPRRYRSRGTDGADAGDRHADPGRTDRHQD